MLPQVSLDEGRLESNPSTKNVGTSADCQACWRSSVQWLVSKRAEELARI
jgi:hypothetical protein